MGMDGYGVSGARTIRRVLMSRINNCVLICVLTLIVVLLRWVLCESGTCNLECRVYKMRLAFTRVV